jgi:hypothetical protein
MEPIQDDIEVDPELVLYAVITAKGLWHIYGGTKGPRGPKRRDKTECGLIAPLDAYHGLHTRSELNRKCRRCPW